MGRWNRRYLYLPRRSNREYEYEGPLLSPPRTCDDSADRSRVADGKVPTWEINYCKSVRIPWGKVLATKKYISTYPNVLTWDDSSGKEAFENAKQRYWAMINGFPRDNPLPDPDMYIEDIDWNMYMDPDMMDDLDRHFCNPDVEDNVEKLETMRNDKNQPNMGNSWETNNVQGPGSLKDDVGGWGQWDNSGNVKNDNPWEQSGARWDNSVYVKKENSWDRSCAQWDNSVNVKNDNPWEQNGAQLNQPTIANPWEVNKVEDPRNLKDAVGGWGQWDNSLKLKNDNSWEQSGNRPFDSWKDDTWRNVNESWGQNQGRNNNSTGPSIRHTSFWSEKNARCQKSRNFGHGNYNTWQNNYCTSSEERGWTDNGNGTSVWRESRFPVDESNKWDSGRFNRGENSFHGGGRKRVSSIQHASKYKSSRYQSYNNHGDS